MYSFFVMIIPKTLHFIQSSCVLWDFIISSSSLAPTLCMREANHGHSQKILGCVTMSHLFAQRALFLLINSRDKRSRKFVIPQKVCRAVSYDIFTVDIYSDNSFTPSFRYQKSVK